MHLMELILKRENNCNVLVARSINHVALVNYQRYFVLPTPTIKIFFLVLLHGLFLSILQLLYINYTWLYLCEIAYLVVLLSSLFSFISLIGCSILLKILLQIYQIVGTWSYLSTLFVLVFDGSRLSKVTYRSVPSQSCTGNWLIKIHLHESYWSIRARHKVIAKCIVHQTRQGWLSDGYISFNLYTLRCMK